MAGEPGAKDAPPASTDEELDPRLYDPRVSERVWMEEHLPELRRLASGQRPLYWILGIGR